MFLKISNTVSRLIWSVFIFSQIIVCSDDNPVKDDGNEKLSNIPNIADIVMYEVNIRAFSESGDFQGVVEKLDYIKSLGANVIWLMPIHPVGQVNSINSPYAVQDYSKVNPEFGTFQDLLSLVEKAHQREIAVIIDWVANHTAWDNPWIGNKDWYTQNSDGQIISPAGTGWQDVADLNYDNQSMRLAMISMMKYWIVNANIDGFRCDAADYVPFDFWHQAIDTLENITGRDLIYLAEGGRRDHFFAGFQMNYGWSFYNKLKDVFISSEPASSLFTTHLSEYYNLPDDKEILRFTTNHDESAYDATPVTLFRSIEGSLSAFVISTYLGGVPLVYGSQEVGVTDNISFFDNDPIDWTLNPDMLVAYKQILSFYNSSAILRTGNLESYNDEDILAFRKNLGMDAVLVLVNTRNRVKTFTIPADLVNTNWLDLFDNSDILLNTSMELQPFQYYVLIDNF